MRKEKSITEIEQEIKILEETLKIAEEIKNSGLILQKFGNRLSIGRDYNKINNPKLKRLAR